MAKGQKRGNREIRKPKSEKPKAPAAVATAGMAMAAALDDRKKKK